MNPEKQNTPEEIRNQSFNISTDLAKCELKKQNTPEEIRNLCQAWEEEHGKINETNFIQCLAHIMTVYNHDPHVIAEVGKIIYELGDIKQCSCCGRAPAFVKKINSESFLLCTDCQALVIFQDLGPREGYV